MWSTRSPETPASTSVTRSRWSASQGAAARDPAGTSAGGEVTNSNATVAFSSA